ncbi:MAG: hypothetical protein RMI79_03730 [Nitrososphaerota archaeon]|nr:hypothetical protein [Nitrososphaerota archaeon]
MKEFDLKNIVRRLDEIEQKLGQGNIILEDRKEIARNGELENRTYYATPDGGVIKTTRLRIYCDWCGRRNENFDNCVCCGKQLCRDCSVYFESRILCPECIENLHPLGKEEFKVLKTIASGIKDPPRVASVTGIKKELVGKYIKSLEVKGLIRKEGFFPFYELSLLDKGIEVLAAYEQILRNHKDIAAFEEVLEGVLSENV